MISLAVIVLIILVAIFAPVFATITGHGVNQQFRTTGLPADGLPVGPSRTFLLGTDDQGRDILVRIAYGARISLFVGVGRHAADCRHRGSAGPGSRVLRRDRSTR